MYYTVLNLSLPPHFALPKLCLVLLNLQWAGEEQLPASPPRALLQFPSFVQHLSARCAAPAVVTLATTTELQRDPSDLNQ